MREITVLEIRLYGQLIGTLTRLQGDRTLFAFTQDYVDDPDRPTLSLSFKDTLGGLITDFRPTQTRVPPFFANMLPEDQMRDYLARRAGVNPKREFFLLHALGRDLPGAITVTAPGGEPPAPAEVNGREAGLHRAGKPMRFSLAGVQLKFSGVMASSGGLTIPVEGAGGSWIIKLPSSKYPGVPENEFSMMSLARAVGIEVPPIKLVPLEGIDGLPDGLGVLAGPALAVQRFDRAASGPFHIEDFAQVFGAWPEDKYRRASAKNIAEVLAAESTPEDAAEFIRRLVFNTLIGNADMHLKNWSLIYRGRRLARLAPAYDFVSTIPYIADDKAALKYGRTKRMDELTFDELAWIAAKARLPEKLVLDTAAETVARFHQALRTESPNLPLARPVAAAIDKHLAALPIAA